MFTVTVDYVSPNEGALPISANLVVGCAVAGSATIMYWRVRQEGIALISGDNRVDVSAASQTGASGRWIHPGGSAIILAECNSQPQPGAVLTTGTQLIAQLVRGV